MSDDKRPVYVTTDLDLWNSADEAHFFVTKGMVKELPEFTTPLIEDALDQGMLREPTKEEMDKYYFNSGMEKALQERRFKAGRNYNESVERYQEYLKQEEAKKEDEKMEDKPEEKQDLPKEEEKKESEDEKKEEESEEDKPEEPSEDSEEKSE